MCINGYGAHRNDFAVTLPNGGGDAFVYLDDVQFSDFYNAVEAPYVMDLTQNPPIPVPRQLTEEELQQAKKAKIDQLNISCNQTIVSGFKSSALGEEHTYGFNLEEDQPNLTGRLTILNANPNYPSPFSWKTLDAGPLPHMRDQFIQVCTDGDRWKDSNIARYWQLKGQVESASTLEEVNAIVW